MNQKSSGPELHEIEPREQVGAVTGDRFELQYHEAAADALQVLDDTQVACIYCEWHDDYVVETAGVLAYRFHQVKTRSDSQGVWTINDFFGLRRSTRKRTNGHPAPLEATHDSIFGRLLDHVAKFGDRCEWFVFVTDAGVANDFDELISEARNASHYGALPGETSVAVADLCAALAAVFPLLTGPEHLFAFLRRLYIKKALGKLGNLRDARTLIGSRIYDMSEVNLTMSESQKIGAELVALVRERSHRILPSLPPSNADLRAAKGLVLDDVLKILSLSSVGYRELKSNGRDSVVTLSRLHRLCKRCAVSDSLIPDLCRLKSAWDAWWIRQRHSLNTLDLIALRKDCADALLIHATGTMDFGKLRTEAKVLAARYVAILTSSEPLTDELVFGLMMALAAETEQ